MRVLLDANILISYLLTTRDDSPIRIVVKAAITGAYTLLLHEAITTEMIRKVRTKPYLSARITGEDLQMLFEVLWQVADEIEPVLEEIPPVTRDPKDDYLLAYALVGQADYLVTGDDDLLSLGEVTGLKIVRPREFAGLLTGNPCT